MRRCDLVLEEAFQQMRADFSNGEKGLDVVHPHFAFSPSSTSRRMASERCGLSSCLRRQPSICFRWSSCQRVPTCVPFPVVTGRPRFLVVSFIDFRMKEGYHKSKPRGSCHFRPGSNPNHEGDKSNDPG